MREGVRNYIHLLCTVFWTAPSLLLLLIASCLAWPRPVDSPTSTGSQGESLQPDQPQHTESLTVLRQSESCEVPSFHRLEFLNSPAPVCLGHINIPFGINRQSVGMGKRTDLVTRAPEG